MYMKIDIHTIAFIYVDAKFLQHSILLSYCLANFSKLHNTNKSCSHPNDSPSGPLGDCVAEQADLKGSQ